MATLSAYTSVFEAVARDYPLRACLTQLAQFCDEIVAVDAGSRDGTWETLTCLARELPQLRIERRTIDFEDPRWALALDGGLKAEARSLCRGDFCWQADLDEIPADDAGPMIRALIDRADHAWPDRWHLIAPIFVEYWGALERVRIDIPVCFPRLSYNHPEITHGVSRPWRRFDAEGRLHAALHRSDSCEYVHRVSFEPLPVIALMPPELEELRLRSTMPQSPGHNRDQQRGRDQKHGPDQKHGRSEEIEAALAKSRYQIALNEALEQYPSVFHLSWLDIERKLQHYRAHWPAFHASLFDAASERSTPSLFDQPWDTVSDDDLARKAQQIAHEGPRILHGKSPPVGNCVRVGKPPPRCAHEWIEARLEKTA